MKNLSFKREPRPTGLSAIGSPYPETTIKMDKKPVGVIAPPTWNSKSDKWVIRFTVTKENILEDGNQNCPWKWVTLKAQFEDEKSAREFTQTHWKIITEKFQLCSI